jgi:hypothetical protein
VDGSYSTASAYSIQFQGSFSPVDVHSDAIWKAKTEGKCKFFMWLLLRWRILMADRLLTRGWPFSVLCPLCGNAPEMADHLVLGCSLPVIGRAFYCFLLFLFGRAFYCFLLFLFIFKYTSMFNLITGASEVDKEDDMFVLIAPQNAVGNCIIDVKILCLSIFFLVIEYISFSICSIILEFCRI